MQTAPPLDSVPHSDPTGAIQPAPSRRRIDIQVLRAVAVLMVVAYHALPGVVKGGFLGVDVFFVISGFLITGHILQDLEARRFRVGGFYARRARRLLPAAWTTLLVTTLLAYPLLTASQWRDYLQQLAGALTFTANIVLARQSGYFEAAASAKPLLHIWSLSLEEQFYFLIPVGLIMLPRQVRGPALIAAAAASLVLCVSLASGWLPAFAGKAASKLVFYSLPSRAWELLVGGVAAWAMLRKGEISPPAWLKWSALAAIAAMCVVRLDSVHPRADAIIVVAATVTLLLGNDGWLRGRSAAAPIAAVGDWSYSIYLVHWPLLAFAHAAWIGNPPLGVALLLAAASIPLGWAQYRWIEQPFQKDLVRTRKRAVAWLSAAAAMIAVASAPAAWVSYSHSPSAEAEPNVGLGKICNQRGAEYQDLSACRTSETPEVAVWGDSYAMHLAPGLLSTGVSLVQITKAACAPALGLVQLDDNYNLPWARQCASFTESALVAIERSPTIRTVVISSPFGQIFDPSNQLFVDGRASPWRPMGVERLSATVRRLQAAGKAVIIVGPTPHASFDAGQCNARLREGVAHFGRADCTIDLVQSHEAQAHVIEGLDAVARQTGAVVLWPETVLCRGASCSTAAGGKVLYRDTGHLTPEGSIFLAKGLGLAERLAANAHKKAAAAGPRRL